ncbi:adenosylmethionine--8-amino-7-oxononanoate transaminase [Sphingobacterium sp. 1.A.4]|uniref:adenosylmethionine--8-amino-7-oxononanoate transaminase n=1 Tax=Sphingobacterium sp. 1.A.4 TaxID=2044603 RepID=UPI000C0BE29A|nr:adenosylmethionine--8-amino-7-oxononanoate transaminase [Sphingobacterium sp. 1.A.4]
MRQLIERDLAVNWHPYSQMKLSHPIPIIKGEGAYLFAEDGQKYLDMVSSWWVSIHGHANPTIAKAVFNQLNTLEQVIFAGFTHEPAILLSERLLNLLPSNQQKVFYSDNGSTAVEVALKMCLQLGHNLGRPKNKILAFKEGYHGDTFGAMSVSERGHWTAPFSDKLFDVIFIDPPTSLNLEQTKELIREHAAETACLIYEPLIQGAGGMLMHSAEDLSELMAFCRSLGILLIQDEVFVGFGRTGTLFAADQLSVAPDVMCFSKGLTGGTMAMGITTCTDEIYQAFYSDEKQKALFHGHSFTASPIGCAAALASLEILLSADCQQQLDSIHKKHLAFLGKLMLHPKIQQPRLMGTVLAFEYHTAERDGYFHSAQEFLYQEFLKRNIIMRPLGNTIYLVPPYCIKEEELEYVYDIILEVLDC